MSRLWCVLQACKMLPKLQVLDDTRLGCPLSPVTKPVLAQNPVPPAAADSQHLARRASRCLSPDLHASKNLAVPGFSSERLGAAGTLSGANPPEHADRQVFLGRPHVRHSMQRPASAGRLHHRLPPVAVGHNQPGSYLLYSMSQLPCDPLVTASAEPYSPVSRPGCQQALRCDTIPHVLAHGAVQDWRFAEVEALSDDADMEYVGGSSTGGHGSTKRVRPASAGIRRAESRLESPLPSEASRFESLAYTVGPPPMAKLNQFQCHSRKQVSGRIIVLHGCNFA